MKLSRKGFQEVLRICWEHCHNYLKVTEELGLFDFKQEHFKGAVLLTVEEAKDLLSWLRNSQWKHEHQCNFEFAEDWRKDMFDCLNARINLAEGYLPIHSTPMEGKLVLPKQAEKM